MFWKGTFFGEFWAIFKKCEHIKKCEFFESENKLKHSLSKKTQCPQLKKMIDGVRTMKHGVEKVVGMSFVGVSFSLALSSGGRGVVYLFLVGYTEGRTHLHR